MLVQLCRWPGQSPPAQGLPGVSYQQPQIFMVALIKALRPRGRAERMPRRGSLPGSFLLGTQPRAGRKQQWLFNYSNARVVSAVVVPWGPCPGLGCWVPPWTRMVGCPPRGECQSGLPGQDAKKLSPGWGTGVSSPECPPWTEVLGSPPWTEMLGSPPSLVTILRCPPWTEMLGCLPWTEILGCPPWSGR